MGNFWEEGSGNNTGESVCVIQALQVCVANNKFSIIHDSFCETHFIFSQSLLVVACKELSTPEIPTIMEDPPLSPNENVISLLGHTATITVPNPAPRLKSLELGTSSPQPSGLCKVQKEMTVYASGARAMETGTYITRSQLSLCQ